jgi:hypothetical protein
MDELHAAMSELGLVDSFEEDGSSSIFDAFDTDGDGSLGFDDFERLYVRPRARAFTPAPLAIVLHVVAFANISTPHNNVLMYCPFVSNSESATVCTATPFTRS